MQVKMMLTHAYGYGYQIDPSWPAKSDQFMWNNVPQISQIAHGHKMHNNVIILEA